MKCGAVILAAGLSSRMGEFKPLLKLGDRTMLQHCVATLQEAGVHRIVVVTGHRGDKVQRAARKLHVRVRHNPDFAEGMFSSVQTGVKEMVGCDAFFMLPVDIPLVRPATVTALLQNFRSGRVLYPEFAGEKGHPPLIPGELCREILQADGSGGLAAVLLNHPGDTLPVWDRFTLRDADTPRAYSALVEAEQRRGVLTRQEADLLAEITLPCRVMNHSRLVARLALALEKGLRKGKNHGGQPPLDRDLIYGSALLHDICKGQRHHAAAGEKLLTELGLAPLGKIVGVHSERKAPKSGILTEKELVCLADKLAQGEKRVSLKERFQGKLHDYRDDKEACRAIRCRLRQAEKLAELWEKSAGKELDTWLKSEE